MEIICSYVPNNYQQFPKSEINDILNQQSVTDSVEIRYSDIMKLELIKERINSNYYSNPANLDKIAETVLALV